MVPLDPPDHSLPAPDGHGSHALEQRLGSLRGDPTNKTSAQQGGGGFRLQNVTETNTQNKKNGGSSCGPDSPEPEFHCSGRMASSAGDLRAQYAHAGQRRGRNTAPASHAQP